MATAVAEERLLAEERMLAALAYLQCAVGCAVLARNRETNLAYGRHASPSFRVRVPARAAWVVQELPSLALPLYQYASESAPRLRSAPNCILLAMFLVHYGHRCLIYPFLMRGGKPMPLLACTMAIMFCTFNGYLQSRYLSHWAVYADDWVTDPRFLIGFGLWLTGMLINIHSDHILRNLRKPGDTGYKIPRDWHLQVFQSNYMLTGPPIWFHQIMCPTLDPPREGSLSRLHAGRHHGPSPPHRLSALWVTGICRTGCKGPSTSGIQLPRALMKYR
ncbi:3-oxo-5-alpha-steroid 4-dehydrogenase 1 isoform X1 [Chlorocebus sabaeus]|uniref:3-oxo-5-alpha-steroid 4-dehydrogenase 1 isoform X1 n=1 Tax=Chlorocebus sabaeus TaxID=60711 RepID=UPI0018B0A9DA|nr:3-oxo-5-alpha-steroid 4-dehydrogenase 1 isoform X1 [Chlorocebus sabaeus]